MNLRFCPRIPAASSLKWLFQSQIFCKVSPKVVAWSPNDDAAGNEKLMCITSTGVISGSGDAFLRAFDKMSKTSFYPPMVGFSTKTETFKVSILVKKAKASQIWTLFAEISDFYRQNPEKKGWFTPLLRSFSTKNSQSELLAEKDLSKGVNRSFFKILVDFLKICLWKSRFSARYFAAVKIRSAISRDFQIGTILALLKG